MSVYLRSGHSYTRLPSTEDFALPRAKVQGGTNSNLNLDGVQYWRKHTLCVTIRGGGALESRRVYN
ncbi:hypothetical protein N7455_005211 [Penicillium solitum]|uniref:uncharacterized protein n=1 Tax=Penicillium solitum TaxID=60172 RepID=UPI0018512843|nr:hypothetical protein HAV15_011039 [Penicillium sp. str. \